MGAEMAELRPGTDGLLTWGNGVVTMTFLATADGPVRLAGLSGRGMATGSVNGEEDAGVANDVARVEGARDKVSANGAMSAGVGGPLPMQRDPRPIVELVSSRDGATDNRQKLVTSAAGAALRFVAARAGAGDGVSRLEIVQCNPAGGPTVTSVFEAFDGLSAVRTWTELESAERFPVEAVSSLSLTLPMDANAADVEHTRILWGDSSWAVENDWHCALLRDTNVRDRNLKINPSEPTSRFARRSLSTWSTAEHQPAGILEAAGAVRVTANESTAEKVVEAVTAVAGAAATPTAPAFSLMWQIEHNGPWEWEVGENEPGLHVTCFGPEYDDHQWFTTLGEGNAFASVPVSFAIVAGGWQEAVGEMTRQRRALRRAKAAELGRSAQFERTQGLVVYNDYMNTLFGNPRLEKELPLIEGAAKAGADVFCIDAGWYDSTDGGWWDMVGEWEPSTNRFGDMGLKGVAEFIREHGMGLGLWLEPEVIGVKSPMAAKLPDSAFIMRHGERVAHSSRYLLDFRSPEARVHVTRTVDRLIDEFGAVFFKFDYNTTPGAGSEVGDESVGGALLAHCRAYLDWLDDLRRRHPDVMIENCGSGAMRADYAQLARLDLQSTSDQCDPLIYAALAAGAGLTIPPEQQGNWGYAQQEMDDETAVMTLAAGILGRLYLSGFINRMDDTRLALVRDAVALHRQILAVQERMLPYWPAGLPDFNGDWLASGLVADGETAGDDVPAGYVTVWRRGGVGSIELTVPEGKRLVQVFPDPAQPGHAPDARPWAGEVTGPTTVRVTAADLTQPSARVFRVE